jgi:hypothetical protein
MLNQEEQQETPVVINFFEAKAARLRKAESKLGGIFRQLENSSDMTGISDELLVQWAERLNRASASDTIHDVVRDIERVLQEQKATPPVKGNSNG